MEKEENMQPEKILELISVHFLRFASEDRTPQLSKLRATTESRYNPKDVSNL